MNIRGTNSARSAASSRVHGVVSVSSTTSEIDSRDPGDDQRRPT